MITSQIDFISESFLLNEHIYNKKKLKTNHAPSTCFRYLEFAVKIETNFQKYACLYT